MTFGDGATSHELDVTKEIGCSRVSCGEVEMSLAERDELMGLIDLVA